jgi:basic amino acid/polyamine antiporter, APA family
LSELKKSWGFFSIIALTITAMVGTGMFFGTAIGARYSGNGVLIAWLILVAITTYIAACFGELIALFPKAGGVYEFSKQAYGHFMSFIIGWITWVMSTVIITVMIIAALDYLLPPDIGVYAKLGIAAGVIVLLNYVAFLGVDISGGVLIVFAVETILLFLAIIIPGFFTMNPSNFSPLLSTPWSMIFVSLFFMVESLMGWESASFLAEETKNATKVIPKALIITTLLAGLLAFGVSIISLGVVPAHQLSMLGAPINQVTLLILGEQGSKLVAMGIVLALIGSVTGTIISTPRLLLAMARDKVFISQLAAIHPKRNTPYKAIIFQTIVSLIILFLTFGKYDFLLSLFTPLAMIMYAIILLAVPILRMTMKDSQRDFRVPFGIIGPIIVSLFYIGVIVAWLMFSPGAIGIFKIVLSLIFMGMPIYLMMIFFYNPDAVAAFMNRFSGINLLFENTLLPKRVRSEMISQVKDLSSRRVLEYGAGVGTLTLQVAKAVGPGGFIYATDLSHSSLDLLEKRLKKRGIHNVEIIHDEHHSNRIHPDVNNVDVIFSVGVLSYIQDVPKVLREMNRILPDSGQICFVEYVNFFKVLPDQEWLSNHERLKKTFRSAGFSVKIHKKAGLFWNYLFIYGIKSEIDIPIV